MRLVIALITLVLASGLLTTDLRAKSRTLARNGKTDYCIVLSTNASLSEKAAAIELAKYLKEISGAVFPIKQDSEPLRAEQIILGNGAKVGAVKLGNEGLYIKTSGEALIIAGGSGLGTINGVYEFLQRFLGCRWYAIDCIVVPRRSTLKIDEIDYTYVPPFQYRRNGWYSERIPDWAAPNHANVFIDAAVDPSKSDMRLADSWWYPQNAVVHTLSKQLCNVDNYFEKHPEYFSEIDGKRVRKETQLCISNVDVLGIVVTDAQKLLKKDPRSKRISISAADCENYCRCANCEKLAIKYGSVAGSYVEFANHCASEIAKTYPDVVVDLLIYRWGRCMPPAIDYSPNLAVQYAPIESCIYHAMDECEYNVQAEQFVAQARAWSKAVRHLSIWFYTDSSESVTPYPILRAMARNFRFARDIGADGIFVEGHARFADSQLGALTSYLVAQLSWNPDFDVQRGIVEFTDAYYGPAASEVRQYVNAANDEHSYSQTNAVRMRPFPGFHVAMQNPEFLDLHDDVVRWLARLFDAAERKVANNPKFIKRVRIARLALQVKTLEQLSVSDPLWQRAESDFWAFLPSTDVDMIKYGSVDSFRAEMKKKVKLASAISPIPQGRDLVKVPELWLFRTDPEKKGEKERWFSPGENLKEWKSISTYKTWDFALEKAPYVGDGWYAIDLLVPRANGKRVWLVFGGVDENFTLWLNGRYVSDNLDAGAGEYDKAIAVEITGGYKPGKGNHLVVRVRNTIGAGGIWKPVRLIVEE